MGQTTNSELKMLIDKMMDDLTVCAHTLRGSNGNPGLVAAVSVLSEKVDALVKKVDSLEVKVTNDLMHVLSESGVIDKKSSAVKFGSWEWFTEKAAMPIIVAVVVSLLAWFLTNILPKVVTHLG